MRSFIMPLFEYECRTCGHRFEALVVGSRTPACPRCASEDLEKQHSTFGCGGPARGFGSGAPAAASCSTGGG
jgi:putative FmdB family regulatory protein